MASSTACEMRAAALSSFAARDRGCAARLRSHVPSPLAPGPASLARSAVRATSIDGHLSDVKPGLERAKMEARRTEQVELKELEKPLSAYMSLPASQYSVLDAERIERVDDNSFKCYAHRLSFMSFEVCPVLLVKVEEKPDGCCIRLLGCQLDGSPIVRDSNDKFSASMENNVSWSVNPASPESSRLLTSDTSIIVTVDIPTPFRIIPKDVIESAGSQVLSQLLRVALPRFLAQLQKDYQAWASGDTSRKPLGTGEI